jgi:integrase
VPGSAPIELWGSRGPGFKSRQPDAKYQVRVPKPEPWQGPGFARVPTVCHMAPQCAKLDAMARTPKQAIRTPGITPHPAGGWRVVASAGSGPDRRRLVRIVPGAHTASPPAEAIAALVALRAELRHDIAIESGESLVGLCRRYVADRARLGRSTTYVAELGRKVDRLATIELGSRPAAQVNAGDLDTLYARLDRDGLGASGIRAWHALISGALSAAVRWGEIDRNVALQARPPAEPRPSGAAPDPELARRYLAAVESAAPTLGALLRLGALTGARRGELCALRWTDLDVDRRTLTIARALTSPKGHRYVEGPTKNGRARVIGLSPEALAELVGHRAQREMLCSLAGVELEPGGFIFGPDAYCDGSTPYRPDYVTRRSREIAVDNGLPVELCHPHGLRHYFASQGIAGGADVAAMAAVLGHDPTLLLSTYAHAVSDAKAAAVAAVGRTLAR